MDYIYIYIDTESVFISYWLLQNDWTQVHSNNVPIDLFLMLIHVHVYVFTTEYLFIIMFILLSLKLIKCESKFFFIGYSFKSEYKKMFLIHIWLIKSTLLKK